MVLPLGPLWDSVKLGLRYFSRRRNRTKVENYLKEQKALKRDKGQRTIIHLAAKLRLSESAILEAVTSNPRIKPRMIVNKKSSRAEDLLYEYDDNGN